MTEIFSYAKQLSTSAASFYNRRVINMAKRATRICFKGEEPEPQVKNCLVQKMFSLGGVLSKFVLLKCINLGQSFQLLGGFRDFSEKYLFNVCGAFRTFLEPF